MVAAEMAMGQRVTGQVGQQIFVDHVGQRVTIISELQGRQRPPPNVDAWPLPAPKRDVSVI